MPMHEVLQKDKLLHLVYHIWRGGKAENVQFKAKALNNKALKHYHVKLKDICNWQLLENVSNGGLVPLKGYKKKTRQVCNGPRIVKSIRNQKIIFSKK